MKKLESYEKDGGYEDENGCHWDELTDFLQAGILEFCCCGNPEDNLILIHDLLVLHETNREKTKDLPFKESSEAWDIHQEELKQFVHTHWKEFLNFFWYVMHQKDVMTHGGSIPGWVEDENFMDALKKWKTEYEKDNS